LARTGGGACVRLTASCVTPARGAWKTTAAEIAETKSLLKQAGQGSSSISRHPFNPGAPDDGNGPAHPATTTPESLGWSRRKSCSPSRWWCGAPATARKKIARNTLTARRHRMLTTPDYTSNAPPGGAPARAGKNGAV
jgi:hypothetical protein